MPKSFAITTLFVDVGGVLLTNGWGRESRLKAAAEFNFDFDEFEERHHLSYSVYEEGRITIEEYLSRILFYQKRPFTLEQFRSFMYAQSSAHIEMINLIRKLKDIYKLKIVSINNEGRELNEYRIMKFKLDTFIDYFISSCFVHVRKPNTDIFRMALDTSQILPINVLYIEDRQLFIDIAADMGIQGILHRDYLTTLSELSAAGLEII